MDDHDDDDDDLMELMMMVVMDTGECNADQRAERSAQRAQRRPRSAERPRERDGLPQTQPEDDDGRDTAADRVVVEECADGARGAGATSGHLATDVRAAETAQPAVRVGESDRSDAGYEHQDTRWHLAQTGVSQRRWPMARHRRGAGLLSTRRLVQMTLKTIRPPTTVYMVAFCMQCCSWWNTDVFHSLCHCVTLYSCIHSLTRVEH